MGMLSTSNPWLKSKLDIYSHKEEEDLIKKIDKQKMDKKLTGSQTTMTDINKTKRVSTYDNKIKENKKGKNKFSKWTNKMTEFVNDVEWVEDDGDAESKSMISKIEIGNSDI